MERERREKRLNLCCDEEMYGKIRRLAQKECRSVSGLIRTLIAEALRQKEMANDHI